MNLKCLQRALLAGWLALHSWMLPSLAVGQVRGQDHPSHRYLPTPTGSGTLSEQIRSLEQLSQAFSSGDASPAPMRLSPEQLAQLDALLESFRDEKGELNLPHPESIPKEWIDSLLPDPKQRQQAKEMLEQYSRSRNLPFKPNNSDASSAAPTDNSEDPSSRPRSRSRSDNQSKSRQDADEPGAPMGNRSQGPIGSSRRSGPTPNQASSPALEPDGEPTELPRSTPPELRKLYETLKQFQQQRAQQEAIDASNRATDSNSPPSRNPRSNRSGTNPGNRDSTMNRSNRTGASPRAGSPTDRNERAPRTNAPRGSTSPGIMPGSPPFTPNNQDNGLSTPSDSVNPSRDSGPGSDPDARDASSRDGDASRSKSPTDPSATPIEPVEPDKPKLTPFDQGYDFGADQKLPTNDPFADPNPSGNARRPGGATTKPAAPRPAEPFQVTRMSEQEKSNALNRSTTSRPEQSGSALPNTKEFDPKKSVDELGLGPALRRIVEKTLQEKGFKDQPNLQPPQVSSTPTGNAIDLQSLPKPGPDTTEQLAKWANSVATSSSNNSNKPATTSNSQWGNWMRDVWRTVANSPTRSSGNGSSTAAAASPTTAGSSLPEFRWTSSMTFAIVLIAGLVGLLFWLSRRREAELADSSAIQAEWVRTVIAQGLKTRADVVRAFHQLVRQSRAVSDWWTHRSIVKHFSSHTPQLATAISELAVVYEQARYCPDDVELSQQQLAHVQTLLESVKIPTAREANASNSGLRH